MTTALPEIYPALLRCAQSFTGGDPAVGGDDIVQTALLKTLGRLDGARTAGEQLAYLKLAIRQVAVDAARAQRHRRGSPESLGWLASPTQGERQMIAAVELELALAQLDAELDGWLVLAAAAGYSMRAIAAATGEPVETVKSRVHRMRRRLIRGVRGNAAC